MAGGQQNTTIYGWMPEIMADGVQFKIEGVDQLAARLKGLDDEVNYKGGRFALRKAANVMRDAIVESAERIDDPRTAEQISKNIAVRWSGRFFKRRKEMKFRVGVLGGARQKKEVSAVGELRGAGAQNPGGDTFYWRFVELGTARVPARPFMRPAFENNLDTATREYVVQFDRAIDRFLRKKARG